MVAKTGLVVPSNRDESKDRWKSDRPGTQILYNRGFHKRNRCGFFLSFSPVTSQKKRQATLIIKIACLR